MKLALIILIFISIHGFAQEPMGTIDTIEKLPELMREALKNNARLQARRAGLKSAEKQISVAGALPDPNLSLRLMNLPANEFAFDREPMTSKQIALMQKIPFPGKLKLKKRIAQQNSLVQKYRLDERTNELKFEIKKSYFEVWYLDQLNQIIQRQIDNWRQLSAVTQTVYRSGKGYLPDLLNAEIKLAELEAARLEIIEQRKIEVAEMNYLLNRPQSKKFGSTTNIEILLPQLHHDSLKTIAQKNRPILLAAKTLVRKGALKHSSAKKTYLPDFNFEFAWSQRDELISGGHGVDFLSGMITLNLPLYFWQKQRKVVETEKFFTIAAERSQTDTQNKIFSEIEKKQNTQSSVRQRLNLYREQIMPKAKQAAQSSLAAYPSGKVDFQELLNNQNAVYEFENTYLRLLTDFHQTVSNLEFLIGKDLRSYE